MALVPKGPVYRVTWRVLKFVAGAHHADTVISARPAAWVTGRASRRRFARLAIRRFLADLFRHQSTGSSYVSGTLNASFNRCPSEYAHANHSKVNPLGVPTAVFKIIRQYQPVFQARNKAPSFLSSRFPAASRVSVRKTMDQTPNAAARAGPSPKTDASV